MNINEINQRIAVVNAESKRLNNERQVCIGRRNTLTDQLMSAFAEYERQFGVKLTIETLDAEMDRVAKLKSDEVSAIEYVLTAIKEGRYADAKKAVTPNVEQSVSSEVTQTPQLSGLDVSSEPVTEVPKVTPTISGLDMPSEPAVTPQMSSPVVPPVVTPVTPPVASPVGTPIVPPPVMPPVGAPAKPENIVAPPPVSVPSGMPVGSPIASPVDAPASPNMKDITSFGMILGGQAFQPGN